MPKPNVHLKFGYIKLVVRYIEMNEYVEAFKWFCLGFTFAQLLDIVVMLWEFKKKMGVK